MNKEHQKHQENRSTLHHEITTLEQQNPQVKKRWQQHRIKEIRQQEQEQINREKQVRKIQHQHDKVLQQQKEQQDFAHWKIEDEQEQVQAPKRRMLREQQEQQQQEEDDFVTSIDIRINKEEIYREINKEKEAFRDKLSIEAFLEENPADKFKYANNYNYNRYNPEDTYVPDEDHDWWYVNEYIPANVVIGRP